MGRVLSFLLGPLYGSYLTLRYVDEFTKFPAIRFHGNLIRVRVSKSKGARIIMRGVLTVEPWMSGRNGSCLSLGAGALLEMKGDFTIGDDVRISVHPKGKLTIGGRRSESASGITMRSVVLAHTRVEIGTDVIIGWDTLITDCDWHTLGTQSCHEDTVVGDHVWIASGARVLKGARIGRDSVVAAQSVVLAGEYPSNSLVAGAPATVKRKPIEPWTREI